MSVTSFADGDLMLAVVLPGKDAKLIGAGKVQVPEVAEFLCVSIFCKGDTHMAPVVNGPIKGLERSLRQLAGELEHFDTGCLRRPGRSDHQARVEAFMAKAGQALPARPEVPDEGVRRLRLRLLWEELLELTTAMGFVAAVEDNRRQVFVVQSRLVFETEGLPDLVGIADGCADLSVVNVGTLSACGIGDTSLLEVVDQNNIAKFGPGGYRDDGGKWIKPPGHRPPDITGVLIVQGWTPPEQGATPCPES